MQANIDPQHRDRIAFVRLCSGRFRRGMKLKNVRTGRLMSVQNPVFFLARERELAEEAWPGDIIGIPNHGSLRIGDTLTEGEEIRVTGMPELRAGDPAPRAHRGPDEVEASAPRARAAGRRGRDPRVQAGSTAATGSSASSAPLQLDVLKARLAGRIRSRHTVRGGALRVGALARRRAPPSSTASATRNRAALAEDHDGVPVFLARNAWDLRTTIEDWPALRFQETREQS